MAGRYLLNNPAVAVRITEEDATNQIEIVPFKARAIRTIVEDLDLTHLDTLIDEMGVRRTYVGDYQEQALDGAGRHIRSSHVDRAGGPGGRQLDHAEFVADPVVDVHVEADLFDIEVLGAFLVRDRNGHHFQLPIHEGASLSRRVFTFGRFDPAKLTGAAMATTFRKSPWIVYRPVRSP